MGNKLNLECIKNHESLTINQVYEILAINLNDKLYLVDFDDNCEYCNVAYDYFEFVSASDRLKWTIQLQNNIKNRRKHIKARNSTNEEWELMTKKMKALALK